MLKQYKVENYKFILVILVIALNVLGVLLVGSARPALMSKQLLGMIVGIFLMIIISFIDYRFVLKYSWVVYSVMLGLLIAVIFDVVMNRNGKIISKN